LVHKNLLDYNATLQILVGQREESSGGYRGTCNM